jgi:hypothetical protein
MFICVKCFVLTKIIVQFVFSRNNINYCSKGNNALFWYSQNIDEGTSPGCEKVSRAEISTFYCHLTALLRFPIKMKGSN